MLSVLTGVPSVKALFGPNRALTVLTVLTSGGLVCGVRSVRTVSMPPLLFEHGQGQRVNSIKGALVATSSLSSLSRLWLEAQIPVPDQQFQNRVHVLCAPELPPGSLVDVAPRKRGGGILTVLTVLTSASDPPPHPAGRLHLGIGSHDAEGSQGMRQQVVAADPDGGDNR